MPWSPRSMANQDVSTPAPSHLALLNVRAFLHKNTVALHHAQVLAHHLHRRQALASRHVRDAAGAISWQGQACSTAKSAAVNSAARSSC